MARFNKATWQGEHSPRTPMSRYDIVCIHTIVGYAPAHAAHFSTRANGHILQSRDTRYRSAANLYGNHRVIAIENEDHGPRFGRWSGSDVPALTPEQVESCAQILAWAHKVHGVPLQLAPDSKPGSRGLAFHRQGCDGNYPNGRVAGGELWSSARGKVCPGDRRIAQVDDILRRAKQIVGVTAPKPATKEAKLNSVQKARSEYQKAFGHVHMGLSHLAKVKSSRRVVVSVRVAIRAILATAETAFKRLPKS